MLMPDEASITMAARNTGLEAWPSSLVAFAIEFACWSTFAEFATASTLDI